jgi:hypothetical protein
VPSATTAATTADTVDPADTVLEASGIERAYLRCIWPARPRTPVLRGVESTLATLSKLELSLALLADPL